MTALEKWKNDFKEFISELSIPRDDYKGIMEYINEVPNEALEQKPCDDCISRQAVDELSKELVHTTRDKADFLCNFWEGLQKLPPVTPKEKTGHEKLTNHEWIDILTEQFDISRTSAKEMLHAMMSVKKEDNFKKQFSQGKKGFSQGFSQGRK